MFSVIEGRVLGCLIEKERTVPDQYPLSMNSLVSACNQSSSRDPVMTLDEHEVDVAVSTLKAQGCARIVHPTHGRGVVRVRQVFDEKFALEAADAAVMGVLLVRGPQTAAELRTRTGRLHNFDNVADVDTCLHQLAERQFVQLIERQHGQKEQRWQQLVAEEAEQSAPPAAVTASGLAGSVVDRVAQLEERVVKLEAALADLL